MILVLLACASLPDTITMTGTVWDAPYGEGSTVAGATVTVTDEALTVIDEQTSGADGVFTALVPAGVPFFVTVSAEEHLPTAFSGTAGISDFTAPAGYPWVAPTAFAGDVRAAFAACPTVAAPGAIVAGEIVADVNGYPPITTASAKLYGPDDTELDACYLDDEGASSADATQTGATGRFAIFGVPPGEIVVDIRYATGSGQDPVELYRFFAPEDGFVPVYPAILGVL